MKLIFIDEFKISNKRMCWYGLVACVIDSAHYEKFKNGFFMAFKNLKWGKKEIKGRYTYSKKGNKEISINERLKFVKKLFNLSRSKTGKNSIIHAYVTFKLFKIQKKEEEIYLILLNHLVKKIPGSNTKKGDKNLLAFFIDNNECLGKEETNNTVKNNLKGKNILFERPFFVDSSNLTPGIILTDFICYFHQNYIQIRDFTEANKIKFKDLVEKFNKNRISGDETEKLKRYLINFKKVDQTKKMLTILSKVDYI